MVGNDPATHYLIPAKSNSVVSVAGEVTWVPPITVFF